MNPPVTPAAPLIQVAPDGCCRVEVASIHDERSGPWHQVQVLALPGGERLAAFSARGAAVATFPARGEVCLAWRDGWGRHWQLQVDVEARTFRTHPHDEPEALSLLPQRLGPPLPPLSTPAATEGAWRVGIGLVNAAGCAALAAAGGWMAWAGQGAGEKAIGAFGLLFFGACLWVALRDLWPAKRRSG